MAADEMTYDRLRFLHKCVICWAPDTKTARCKDCNAKKRERRRQAVLRARAQGLPIPR